MLNKKEEKMDKAIEKIALLYCKWCPNDCEGLTVKEKVGCLAASGFADEFVDAGYRLPKELKVLVHKEIPWQ